LPLRFCCSLRLPSPRSSASRSSAPALLWTQAGHIAIILLLVGGLAATAGTGLVRGRLWAWLLSIALFGVNALGDVVSLLITRDWPRGLAGFLIDALLLFLLLRTKVRAFFLNRA
jgi:hypothetical protein